MSQYIYQGLPTNNIQKKRSHRFRDRKLRRIVCIVFLLQGRKFHFLRARDNNVINLRRLAFMNDPVLRVEKHARCVISAIDNVKLGLNWEIDVSVRYVARE